MKKDQIVKALECCANYRNFGDCDKCPAREGCDTENNFLEKEALSLIREQEKRIKELETSCTELTRNLHACKADTVRKMQELLCEDRVSNDPVVIAVNVAANQLLEETT